MLKKNVQSMLNEQVEREAYAAFFYFSIGAWMDSNGYVGTAKFFYSQADEEMEHMKKIFHYINNAGGQAVVPSIDQPPKDFKSYKEIMEKSLDNEKAVTEAIHQIVETCLKEKDYTTFNLMQWYVDEQLEEENLFSTILDKLHMLGDGKEGLYLLDQELGNKADNENGGEEN